MMDTGNATLWDKVRLMMAVWILITALWISPRNERSKDLWRSIMKQLHDNMGPRLRQAVKKHWDEATQ